MKIKKLNSDFNSQLINYLTSSVDHNFNHGFTKNDEREYIREKGLTYPDEMTEDVENNESYEAGCSWSVIPSARYPSLSCLLHRGKY